MLVACENCGAPLDVQAGESVAKCHYCGVANRVKSMKTIAMQTPQGWTPPPMWQPPPHLRAQFQQPLALQPRPLVPPLVVQPTTNPAGCIVLGSLVGVLGIGAAAFFIVGGTGSRSLPFISGPDPDQPPTLGVVSLDAEAVVTRGGMVDGSSSASSVRQGCTGYITNAPQLAFTTAQTRVARIDVQSGTDTTLVVRDSNGTVHCDDDSGGGRNPRVEAYFYPGRSVVWIGTFSQNEDAVFNLSVTAAMPGSTLLPTAVGATGGPTGITATLPATAWQPAGAPSLGVLDLALQPSGGTLSGSTEPAIQAGTLSSGCQGWVAPAPQVQLEVRVLSGVRITTQSTEDLTLLVRQPDGTIRCDDDGGGNRQPQVQGPFVAGTYRIWVGQYSQGAPTAFQVTVAATNASTAPPPSSERRPRRHR